MKLIFQCRLDTFFSTEALCLNWHPQRPSWTFYCRFRGLCCRSGTTHSDNANHLNLVSPFKSIIGSSVFHCWVGTCYTSAIHLYLIVYGTYSFHKNKFPINLNLSVLYVGDASVILYLLSKHEMIIFLFPLKYQQHWMLSCNPKSSYS